MLETIDKFLFVRHGETDLNRSGVFQGLTDIGLNKAGLKQAQNVAETLLELGPAELISSPLTRAVETAGIISDRTKLPMKIEPDLIECDFGSLEGLSIRDEMQKFGATELEHLAKMLPEDAEQWADLRKRTLQLLNRLAFETHGTLVLISHDAVLQSISEQLCGQWFKSKHCIPYLFSKLDGDWFVAEFATKLPVK